MFPLFTSSLGKIIITLLCGIGIAVLFFNICEDGKCYVVDHADKDTEKHVYDVDNGCLDRDCHKNIDPATPQMHITQCEDNTGYLDPKSDWNDFRPIQDCDDAYNAPETCYKFNPMDSIFRAPSTQEHIPYY